MHAHSDIEIEVDDGGNVVIWAHPLRDHPRVVDNVQREDDRAESGNEEMHCVVERQEPLHQGRLQSRHTSHSFGHPLDIDACARSTRLRKGMYSDLHARRHTLE